MTIQKQQQSPGCISGQLKWTGLEKIFTYYSADNAANICSKANSDTLCGLFSLLTNGQPCLLESNENVQKQSNLKLIEIEKDSIIFY